MADVLTSEADTVATPETAEISSIETPEEKQEHKEEEEEDDDVVVLLCILNQDPKLHEGSRIWRRIAVPYDFSLMELHVTLQNTFEWENMHLHSFQQPRKKPELTLPSFSGFGKTNIEKATVLDIDTYGPSELRVFQSVLGIKDASGAEFLTPMAHGEEGSEEEAVVFAQHTTEELPESLEGVKEVLEERAYLVGDVLNAKNPALVYEYDFGLSHEVTLLFEGTHQATEGVNYPTCLAGQGASRAEDGNDMDEEGNLQAYNYEEFSVLEVIANYTDTYIDSWPLGPGSEDIADTLRCYMCRYNHECSRRRECTGACCDYCLKSELAVGAVSLEEADALFFKTPPKAQGTDTKTL